MMTLEEFKTDWIGLNKYQDEETGKWFTAPMERQEYYNIHMDEGITIEDAYEQLLKCRTFCK